MDNNSMLICSSEMWMHLPFRFTHTSNNPASNSRAATYIMLWQNGSSNLSLGGSPSDNLKKRRPTICVASYRDKNSFIVLYSHTHTWKY